MGFTPEINDNIPSARIGIGNGPGIISLYWTEEKDEVKYMGKIDDLVHWEVEAAGIEPPEYPETFEYTDATGRTTISELRDFDVAVTDAGLDDWQHLIRRVAPSRFVALWRVANRLRATAIEALIGGRGRQADRELERELTQSREETARLSRELEFRDAEIAALTARVAELEGAQQ
ncbi:uncharacterized protein LOC141616895 [Silene latifolia]|uniref:uncharacterized protein LOC141616895 n=1 Tax=Silene latifolia TaxID=37657 RepID=UPI003D779ECD